MILLNNNYNNKNLFIPIHKNKYNINYYFDGDPCLYLHGEQFKPGSIILDNLRANCRWLIALLYNYPANSG